MSFVVNRRDGLFSIQTTARSMCRFIVKFDPVIRRLYPDNATLIAALETALIACTALEAAVTAQREPGV